MKTGWMVRFIVAVLRYPAPGIAQRWGYWTAQNRNRGLVSKWIWRESVNRFGTAQHVRG
jgi:hypothetical protein